MTRGNRFLLVDGDPKSAEAALQELALGRLVNEVVVVRDAREALDYVVRRGIFRLRDVSVPALILLNVDCPACADPALLEHLKATPGVCDVPVVVLSAGPQPVIAEWMARGAAASVGLPLRFDELCETLSRLGVSWSTLPP